MRFDDDSSEDDDGDSLDEGEEKEQFEEKLKKVWQSISPPVPEVELCKNWYVIVFCGKRRKMLYVAKLIHQFIVDDGGPIDILQMRYLMPKNGSGNVLDDTPLHLPDDVGDFKMKDVIAGPLTVTPTPPRKFIVEDYDRLVELYHKVKDLDLD